MTNTTRVGVVGAGQMGSGIVEVALKAGSDVLLWDTQQAFLDAGRERIITSLDRLVAKEKMTEQMKQEALSHLTLTTDLEDFADREIVMEAIIEDLEIKSSVFKKLDEVVKDPSAPLCSNTSSLPIQKIASATAHPERVVGLHFFNPVPVMPLVELITTLTSSDEVARHAESYAQNVLKKTVVHAQDRSGFIVNFLLVPYLLSAVRMVQDGVATKEDIDAGMKLGAGYPMGPLTLADMVGLDVCVAIADVMYKEYGDPSYACPPLLRRMVEAGQLGRKTARGFYTYE